MRLIAFSGVAFVLVAAGCTQQPASNQGASLDGDWKVVAIRGDGIVATPTELEGMRWKVTHDEIVGSMPDGSSGKMSFMVDQSATPNQIDITAIDGNRKGETDVGIYSLEGQRLRICLAEVGKARPDQFQAGPASWVMELEKFRR